MKFPPTQKVFLPAVMMIAAATDAAAAASSRSLQPSANFDLTNCTPVTSNNFNIELINMGSNPETTDPRYVEAFELAAARWSKIIVGDVVPNFAAGAVNDWFAGAFDQPYNGAVDDLVIGYEIPATLDGPGGTLGSAGSVFVRQDKAGNMLSSVSGIMRFDGADLDRMDIADVKAVMLHEMGHVLGLVGTTSSRCNAACNPITANQPGTYSCPLAPAEYANLATGSLLLENNGGMGTACGHWEEDVFRTQRSSELMTGFFEANLFQPISLVSVAGLDDLNAYEVDYCGADIWPATEDTIGLWEVFKTSMNMTMEEGMMELIPPSWVVEENGEVTPLDPMTGAPSTTAPSTTAPSTSEPSTSSGIATSLQAVAVLFVASLLL